MDRIQHETASQTRPAYNPTGTKGFARDYDPETGKKATVNTAGQYNSIQETLMHTIEEAGLEGNHDDDTLLTQAIKKLSDSGELETIVKSLQNGFSHNFAQNGYQKLPSGLIIQWGSYQASDGGSYNVSFPMTFPHSAFHIVGIQYQGSVNSYMNNFLIKSKTNSGFSLKTEWGATCYLSYIAIGN